MRWTPEEGFFLLERHLARLEYSARHFQFICVPREVRAALDRAVQSAERPLRVRLLMAQDGSLRVEHTPLEPRQGAMRVGLAAEPIDPTDVFLYHKTTNRAVYDRARRLDCDDVVLWNAAEEATETSIANLVVELDGRRVTPPVECGLLPGTFRAELVAADDVIVGRVTLAQLRMASRFWLVNSVRGWVPGLLVRP
jgi:para-aminobenzoate synthetase/4-amino-4-deoxychorismate lyase